MATESYGTFVKDGRTKIARSRAARVRFLFNGWAEQTEPAPAPDADPGDASADADTDATATAGASTSDSAFGSADSSKPAPRRSDK